MSLMLLTAASLLMPLALAQTIPTTPTTPATTPAAPAESSATQECSWDGSVSEYLKCQKESVSTTTLIMAGIGVTVGILLLVGLGVWLCHRQRTARSTAQAKQHVEARQKTGQKGQERQRRQYDSDDSDSDLPIRSEKQYRSHDEEAPPLPRKGEQLPRSLRDPRAARVDSASSSSDIDNFTPPPPHPAHVVKPSLPSQILNSPVNHETARQLYPANPSFHSQNPSNLRSSMYTKRQSVMSTKSTRFTESPTPMPPVPVAPIPVRSGTAPLTIRKSVVGGSPPQSRRPSGAIPSYYEATQGQDPPAMPRPASRVGKPPVSMYGPGGESAPHMPPPVPLANRPQMDVRRPSAPAVPMVTQPQRKASEGPRRGSAERGGMI